MKQIVMALAGVWLLAGCGQNLPADGPGLSVLLAPYGESEVEGMDVTLRLSEPGAAAGDALLSMPVVLVGTPTAAYSAEQVQAADEQGELVLTARDEDPTSSGQYRSYLVPRDTVGDVTVSYRAEPRQVDKNTRNGPLFDVRPQDGGIMGAGVYFMLLPSDEQAKYDVGMDWDFSNAPAGTSGAWSLGEGEQELTLTVSNLRFAYYAAGEVKRAVDDPDAAFNLYWITEPPFNIEKLAANITRLFKTMAEFHGQPDASYRVFIRSNPHAGGGGTGFIDSFAFSWGIDEDASEDGPLMLLSHEIAHNWTGLNGKDEPHALTAWYSEGTAEYYKVVMAHRAGLMSRAEVLETINDMAEGYYSNPYVAASNEAAGEMFWKDGLAQRVPYGRGFMYLTNADAKIIAASDGEATLDTLVLQINALQDEGENIGNERWQQLLAGYIGNEAFTDHQAMVSGELIVPHPQAWGPCFAPYQTQVRGFELGFDRMNLGQVTNLTADSNAAIAGLLEGDKIVSFTPLRTLRDDVEAKMTIIVERDGETFDYTYLPRGDSLPAWLWRDVAPEVDDCQI
ncbi:hypothetical protein IDSA_08955 [Pseudidiomarina salinarum]|uniref:Peptidase M61 catalytic domain-containing protein n=1 Tax=Pseudidiomarina salinarum TaxID=435908 RepID=A0A094ISI3_9GAMM|nr:hypothetical protein [Pseudidiomarina salinarum]KFZ30650.1 hypothetical protein IDSA_08955 [Pseudidiomarina salinarum]RUO69162.1 hypothetical protein CWI79_09645 [Pseudidiomarina salinarum]